MSQIGSLGPSSFSFFFFVCLFSFSSFYKHMWSSRGSLTGVSPRHIFFFLYIILFMIIVVSLTLVTFHNSLNTIINRVCTVNSWPTQRRMSFGIAAKTNKQKEWNIICSKMELQNINCKFLLTFCPLCLDNYNFCTTSEKSLRKFM